ncbi:MAG: hypothetical protein HZB38_15595 [Planctomycetes bacterium]|nr:hypothetical protein [Planctomycetota bacterium]
MNAKNILALIEAHIEKGIIGLAVVFGGLMIWWYGLGTPNKVDFGGQSYGPHELAPAILDSAKSLKTAMDNASAEDPKPQGSSDKLIKRHNEGIFAEIPPAKPDDPNAKAFRLQPAVRVLTSGGHEAVVPGLKESEEAPGSVTLITPLAPQQPKMRNGRSLAVQKPTKLGETAKPNVAAGTTDSPREVAWASGAMYWPKDAHKAETTRNGYAAYRSKIYVTGIDVERQELLANGDWSEPKLVEGSKAMPELTIPEPAIDDKGNLINKADLDGAFRVVKAEQNMLMQPPFYTTSAGDQWSIPPLKGFEEEEEEEIASATPKPKKPERAERPERPTRGTGGVRGGGRGPIGGGEFAGGGGRFGGGGEVVGGGRMPGGAGGAATDRKAVEEAKKLAKSDLKEAQAAYDKKDYTQAMTKAQAVVGNEHATKADHDKAQDLIEKADKKLAEAGGGGGGRAPLGGGRIGGDFGGLEGDFGPTRFGGGETLGGRGMGMMPTAAPTGAQKLVTSPDDDKLPAVFFHDDTVEAGKTYRYRSRVNVWNRYVGRIRSLKDPEGAKLATLHGEWSFWSDPVTITPSTYFFVRSLKPGTDRVVLEVWKWIGGKWIKRPFEASVGEMIGGEVTLKPEEVEHLAKDEPKDDKKASDKGRLENFTTGAIVLDIRVDEPTHVRVAKGKGAFDYREQKTLVVVYLDPADGQVKERTQAADQSDPLRKKLEADSGG